MTNREFFTAIASMTNISAELVEHATNELEKLDKKNAARSAKPNKNQKENELIKENILIFLSENKDYHTASEISTALEISVQKASALCRQLVEGNKIEVKEVKVPKKGKQKAYIFVPSDEVEIEE